MGSNLPTVLLRDAAVLDFETFVLPLIQDRYEQDGEPDYIARSEAWNDWTDSLCKDQVISDWQYANWSQPACCGY